MASGCYLSLSFTNDNFDSSFVFHSVIPAGTSRILAADTYMACCWPITPLQWCPSFIFRQNPKGRVFVPAVRLDVADILYEDGDSDQLSN